MNALTHFERLDDLIPDMLRRFPRPFALPEDFSKGIRIDVSETDKAYEVRAEVPGARKDDIKVSVNQNFIAISAEIKREKEEKDGARTLVKETCAGLISRAFSVPEEVDAKGATARFEHGILKLTLPKHEGHAGRTLTIE